MTAQKPKRRPLGFIVVAAAVVIAAGGLTAITLARSGQRESIPASLTFEVASGPLTISVSESGTIRARQQEIIKSEVEGQTTILFLVPEGTQVKGGDLLVELDSSRLLDQQVERSISVQNAEASFIRSRENKAIVENQTTADISRAMLDAQFAVEDLHNYEFGTYPRDFKDLDSRVTMAEEELKRAEQKLEWSQKLFAEGYISKAERDADAHAERKAKLDLELAQTNRKLLQDFTKERRMTELKSNVEQTRMALERVKRRAEADLLQAQTDLRVRESELRRQEAQLERINRQIERTKIYAPGDGLVVYATTGQGGFRGNTEPLAEGQSVRERQELIHLPRTTAMMAEVSVHESVLDKVRVGLPVRITIDALPGRSFRGRVARVAPLPDAQSIWMNPDLKVYRTEIHVEGDASDLRTGMSCRAEIIVDQIQEATFVPVQSVLRVGGEPTVYIVNAMGQTEQRRIELGQDNNRMAHILSGVQPGERVLLSPPLADASAPRMDEQFEIPTSPPRAAPPTADLPPGDGRFTGDPLPDETPADGGEARPRGRRAGGPPQGGQGGPGGAGMGAMTPEQAAEMRRRMENMSPEELEQMRRRRQQREGEPG